MLNYDNMKCGYNIGYNHFSKGAMTKKELRQKIYNKYDGHCAYCGCDITSKNFQVDHILPVRRGVDITPGVKYKNHGTDTESNMMPACRKCNNRKNVLTIEQFRSEISKQVERLKRDSNQFNLALRFGLIEIIEKPVVFYFEIISRQKAAPWMGDDVIYRLTEKGKAML